MTKSDLFMIHTALIQISRLAYQSDYIAFYYKSVFGQDVLFQITWNQHEAQWFRYTLTKPTPPYQIRKEWGNTKPAIVLPIWHKIRQLSLPTRVDCSTTGRDGHSFNLEVGDSFSHLAYQWYEVAVPDSWEILNVIAHELMAWQAVLVGKAQELYEINHEEEENDLSLSCFWEIKIV